MSAFDDALDDAEEETEGDSEDLDEFMDDMSSGPKTKTAGFGVTPEMHAFLEQLRDDDTIDHDPYETFRDHVEKLARRHPGVAEKAKRIHEIKTE